MYELQFHCSLVQGQREWMKVHWMTFKRKRFTQLSCLVLSAICDISPLQNNLFLTCTGPPRNGEQSKLQPPSGTVFVISPAVVVVWIQLVPGDTCRIKISRGKVRKSVHESIFGRRLVLVAVSHLSKEGRKWSKCLERLYFDLLVN